MHTSTTQKSDDGYILLYVMLAMTLFAVLATSVVKSTVEEVELGAQELAAVKAQAAADAAIECFSYWARQPDFPFNTNTPAKAFNCNTGFDSSALTSPTSAQTYCTETTVTYLGGPDNNQVPVLANGGCADVQVQVLPRPVTGIFTGPAGPMAQRTPLCSVRIRAIGYDACGGKAISRTRWETIGGWSSATNPTNTATPIGNAPVLLGPTASPEGYSINGEIAPYAILQVEVSGVSGTTHETNTIQIRGNFVDTIPPTSLPPGVDAVDEVVWYQLTNATALTDVLGATAGVVQAEFRDDDVDPEEQLFTAFGEWTKMSMQVPGNTPEGFYRLAVRVRYGALVYDDVMVYLDVTKAGRGQE